MKNKVLEFSKACEACHKAFHERGKAHDVTVAGAK
jgi:hypothetical protein